MTPLESTRAELESLSIAPVAYQHVKLESDKNAANAVSILINYHDDVMLINQVEMDFSTKKIFMQPEEHPD